MWRGDFYGRICLSVFNALTFGSSYLESSFGATKIAGVYKVARRSIVDITGMSDREK